MLPIENNALQSTIDELGIINLTSATIRQIGALSEALEQLCGEEYIHFELGNPGLPPSQVGVQAEIEALGCGVAGKYPAITGIPQLKKNGVRFVKAFLDVDTEPRCIIPTVGSMQASFTLMLLLGQRIPGKDSMLFINPGFPAQRHQAKVLGLKSVSFDLHDFRGKRLEGKLEEMLSKGNITGIIYSNPNNPAWTNLTEEELSIIGRMATKYDAIVIEDLAYLGMDFRKHLGHPGEPPFIPTVARYTDNYILMISASKIFSYAGQRIAMVCMSPEVYKRSYPYLESFYEMANFGDCYVFGVLYTASSGTSHSAQYALSAMLEASVEGRLHFVDDCSEYARRAYHVKKLLAEQGFYIVYPDDDGCPISDGFFFTAGYPGLDSEQLQRELLRYGISSISLPSTGSEQAGVRICVSCISTPEQFAILGQRLKKFHHDHS